MRRSPLIVQLFAERASVTLGMIGQSRPCSLHRRTQPNQIEWVVPQFGATPAVMPMGLWGSKLGYGR